MSGLNLDSILAEATQKASQEIGKVNILVAGSAGVGKSTLINAVFGAEVAITGVGEAQTKSTTAHERAGSPLKIYDTRGFEIANSDATVGGVRRCIQDLRRSTDENDQIHLVWTCILEQSHRIEPVHQNLLTMVHQLRVPSIVVITQALGDPEMETRVRELAVPNDRVIAVLAEPKKIAGFEIPATGLSELIENSLALVPKARRAAFIAAQSARWDLKEQEVFRVINETAILSAGSALIPIPGGHSVALIGLQAKLIAQINSILGIGLDESGSKEIAKGMLGIMLAKTGGTLAFTELMRLVPGVGWFGAAMIGGPVGGAATKVFGHLYYQSVVDYARKNQPLPSATVVAQEIERNFQSNRSHYESLLSEPGEANG